jgi:arylsulfatase A-like enzyme
MKKLLPCTTWILLLVAACSRGAPEAGVEPLVLADHELPHDFARGIFPTGHAELFVEVEGRGELKVTASAERETTRTVIEESSEGPARTLRGTLSPAPAAASTRATPLLLRFESSEGLSIKGYSVRAASATAGATAVTKKDLRGSLRGRDVVLILFDSVHSGHLGSYGYERATTPHISKVAERGVRFDRAYSQTSWTISSAVSLFTSLDQERHGVLLVGQGLSDACTTLAELFQGAGYRTEGLVQNGVLGPKVGIERGFDRLTRPGKVWHSTDQLFNHVRDVLLTEHEKPAFVYAHVLPPHMPYEPPADFQGRFAPEYDGEETGSIRSIVRAAGKPRDHPDLMHVAGLYDEMIASIDARVGALVAELEAAERLDQTLILIVSDHGEAFNQHGITGHNFHVYEEMVRVPWVLMAAGSPLPTGVTIDAPVTLMDVAPTLVELCALPEPEQDIVGHSRVDLLAGAEAVSEPIFLSARYREREGVVVTPQIALLLDGYKLVADPAFESVALFDLEHDPEEQDDVADEHPIRASAMTAALRVWHDVSRKEMLPAPHVGGVDVKALRDLGYLEGEEAEAGGG